MNHVLNLKRLGFLARKDFFQIWRSSAVTAGVAAGTVLIISLLTALFGHRKNVDYEVLFGITLLVWGCVAAGLSFHELHDKTKNEDFLLLPASGLEKTVVRLIRVSVVLPLFILVLITAASLLSEVVNLLILGMPPKVFNPFAGDSWRMLGYTVILQSFFFLGAAWFKKAHLIKTILTAIVLSFIFGAVGVLVSRILFASYFYGFFTPMDISIDLADVIHSRFPVLTRTLSVVGRIIGYGLLAPFCWFVAWLRVGETQSSDGV